MSLLIGLIDQEIGLSDKISWGDSKIGGQPVWMTKSNASATQKCPGCAVDMTLVVQLYCPLSNSAYHRCLYIFVCASQGCPLNNSWRVYRAMQYDETYAPISTKKNDSSKLFDDDMWTDDQNDWGDDDDDDDWGATASNSDWGEDCKFSGESASNNNTKHNAFHQNVNSNSNLKPSNHSNSSQISSPNKIDGSESIQGVDDDFESYDPAAESKNISSNSSPHEAADEDLSACFATMDVEGHQSDISGTGGDALIEDLNVPDTSRLDQLASVLNTKYKDCTPSHQPTSRQPLLLKPYYLSVVDGNSNQSHNATYDEHIASLIRDYEEVEGKQIKEIISERAQTKGKGGSEGYEKSHVKHGDKVFHKFWKEIQKFPEQCIRYERCGEPLLVQSLNPAQSIIPPCSKCGCRRVFELQLVPALIPWLCSQKGKASDIEFGAILVYTCEKSCPPSNCGDLDLIEEHVIFQHDPDHHLYR